MSFCPFFLSVTCDATQIRHSKMELLKRWHIEYIYIYIYRASVKPTYGVNYVLKSPPYAEIQDQRRPPYFQYSVLYAQTQTPRRPLQWQNPAHVPISSAYLWRNRVCACARPRVCRSVICSYWTSCIGQPIIRVPQVHEWQVSHVAISGFWPLIAVEVWKINRSIVHRISSWLAII